MGQYGRASSKYLRHQHRADHNGDIERDERRDAGIADMVVLTVGVEAGGRAERGIRGRRARIAEGGGRRDEQDRRGRGEPQ